MKPKRSIRISRKAVLAAASLALIVVIVIRSNATVLANSSPRMDSYRLVDDRTIILTVAVGPRSWTRVTRVTETPTDVQITVESLVFPIPLPATAHLELRELTISLADDLGTRVVRDADGLAVPSR